MSRSAHIWHKDGNDGSAAGCQRPRALVPEHFQNPETRCRRVLKRSKIDNCCPEHGFPFGIGMFYRPPALALSNNGSDGHRFRLSTRLRWETGKHHHQTTLALTKSLVIFSFGINANWANSREKLARPQKRGEE